MAGLGAALAVAGLFGIAASLVVGRVIERLGTKRVIALGSLLLVGSLPVIGGASNTAMLLVGLIGITVADLFVDVAMNLQGSWLSARRSTPVMNRLHGLWSSGTVVGGVAAAAIAFAGVPLFAHLGGVAVLCAVILLVATRGLLTTDEVPAPENERHAGSRRGQSSRRGLVLLALVGGAAFAAEIVPGDWAAVRLVEDLDSTPGFASLGYLTFTLGMTIGRLSGDWIEVHVGRARLVGSAVVVAAAGIVVAGFTSNEVVALGAYLVSGLGTAPLFPALYDLAARRRGRPGAGLGALTAGTRIASLAAPAAIGVLAATDLPIGTTTALITVTALVGVATLNRALTPSQPSTGQS